jgi:hypothetical protein
MKANANQEEVSEMVLQLGTISREDWEMMQSAYLDTTYIHG